MFKNSLRLLVSILVLMVALASFSGLAGAADVRVSLDGRPLTLDVAPLREGGSVLVPLRSVLGAVGAEVNWDGRTRSATVTRGRTTVILRIDSAAAVRNGAPLTLDASPRLIGGRTFVPLGVLDAVGTGAAWRERDLTVAITSPPKRLMTLATTTSTYDSGLLQFLLPYFENSYDYEVKTVSVGTGAALALGRDGNADVVLVHARQTELEQVAQGFFVNRREVMYNDFIIVGPAADPAGVRQARDAAAALRAIAGANATFVSRGDRSGTHIKENELWRTARLTPSGAWYLSAGAGMADTLRMADERRGYTLTDRGTFYAQQERLPGLTILFEGGFALHNQYGIMAVNPARHPGINFDAANDMIHFFVSTRGQTLIESFKDPRGRQLFFPNATITR